MPDVPGSGRPPRLLAARAALAVAVISGAVGPAPARAQQAQAKASPSAGRPMNVVFILADDLGWSDLGIYGADLHDTPNLDRLASQGVRFTSAYAASVCSPTRASIMTGKHHARLHVTTWYESSASPPRNRKLLPPTTVANLPHEEVTLAEVFQAAGHLTALVGKWHLGDAAFYPETQGFDVNVGGTFWGAPHTFFFPYRGAGSFGNEFRYVPHLEMGKPGEYLTDRLTDEALKIIDAAGDRPFFLYLAHHAPHTPIEAKADIVKKYESKSKPGMKHTNLKYAAMIHSLDEGVGRILERLDKGGLADRTVVVFTSDNGGFVNQFDGMRVTNNDPLRSGKGSLYEGGVRVPLIVRWPGVAPAGAVCPEPVTCADYYPTLLEVAGLEGDPAHNAGLDGRSLVPLLKAPDSHLDRDAIFHHYPHYYATTTPVSAIRAGKWKYLEYLETGKGELYDLADDLRESKDLSAKETAKVAELRTRLHQWRQEVNAQMPKPNPDFTTGGGNTPKASGGRSAGT
jgi:arylsulfatase A-like enzyme